MLLNVLMLKLELRGGAEDTTGAVGRLGEPTPMPGRWIGLGKLGRGPADAELPRTTLPIRIWGRTTGPAVCTGCCMNCVWLNFGAMACEMAGKRWALREFICALKFLEPALGGCCWDMELLFTMLPWPKL